MRLHVVFCAMTMLDQPPVLRGEPFFTRRVPSRLELKNGLIDEILNLLEKRGLLKAEDDFKVRLCLDEALVNAIRHGNGELEAKQVDITMRVWPGGWSIVVEDEGDGFEYEDIPDTDDPEALLSESGRGILLMKELMDECVWWARGTKCLMSMNTA